jgi:hypothetical protein
LGHTYFIILGLIMFLDPMSVIEWVWKFILVAK